MNNNTYLLYQKGWHGINIDLDRKNIDLFKYFRSKDENINCAVSSAAGEKDLFYAEIDSHSGKGSFENMLNHHKQCRTGSGPNGPQYVECPKEWFWN